MGTITNITTKNRVIDTHSHILFNLDDSVNSIEESIDIAKAAFENRVKTIIATPHKIKGQYDFKKEQIKKRINELQKALDKNKIDIKILFGAENHIDFDMDYSFTLNNKNYFLLEFPMNSYPSFCEDVVDDLLKKKIIPIIAHPESNSEFRKNPLFIEGLINKGCLMQLNTTSFFRDKDTKDFAKFLLKNNVYHLISSNVHYVKQYTYFTKVIKKATSYLGEEKVKFMTQTLPEKIIKGERYIPDTLDLKEKPHTRFGIRAFLKRIL